MENKQKLPSWPMTKLTLWSLVKIWVLSKKSCFTGRAYKRKYDSVFQTVHYKGEVYSIEIKKYKG